MKSAVRYLAFFTKTECGVHFAWKGVVGGGATPDGRVHGTSKLIFKIKKSAPQDFKLLRQIKGNLTKNWITLCREQPL